MASVGILMKQLRPQIVSSAFHDQPALAFKVLDDDVDIGQQTSVSRLQGEVVDKAHLHPLATSRTSSKHAVLVSALFHQHSVDISDGDPRIKLILPMLDS